MRFTFTNDEETNEENDGSSFLAGGELGASLISGSFLPSIQEQDETSKRYGNYRGTRYMIVAEEGAYMTLSKTMTGDTISVSSCNVSDVSTDSTTREVICPGDNQCRRDGLKQGPYCSPIKPSEGALRYPRPI